MVYDLGSRVYYLWCKVYNSRFKVYDLGWRIYSLGCRVYDLRFMIYDLGLNSIKELFGELIGLG